MMAPPSALVAHFYYCAPGVAQSEGTIALPDGGLPEGAH